MNIVETYIYRHIFLPGRKYNDRCNKHLIQHFLSSPTKQFCSKDFLISEKFLIFFKACSSIVSSLRTRTIPWTKWRHTTTDIFSSLAQNALGIVILIQFKIFHKELLLKHFLKYSNIGFIH
jgi:hypothetical protein